MKIPSVVLLFFIASLAHAGGDQNIVGYKCSPRTLPEKMFRDFVQRGFVRPKPYRSEDSLEYHEGTLGYTFYDYPLIAITGWSDNPFFAQGMPGTKPTKFFEVVVQAPSPGEVWSHMQAIGTDLGANQMTTIGRFNGPLPPSVDHKATFIAIGCNPDER